MFLKKSTFSALRIALFYLVLGALWILFSDRIVDSWVEDAALLSRVQTIKGWGYVALTAWLLYLLIRASIEQITRLSYHSHLTGLPNRQALDEFLETRLHEYRWGNEKLSMMLLDLDDFQSVNDSAGYYGGDLLLKDCAALIDSQLPGKARLYHFGADKFVLLVAVDSLRAVENLAGDLSSVISQELHVPGSEKHSLTVSIGIATCPLDTGSGDELLKFADAALQEAKLEKGGMRFYHQELHQRHLKMVELAREVVAASREPEQFSVLFQPQYALESSEITGVEALVRWNHPERGVVSPAEFIPVAEKSGAIFAITERVINHAVAELASRKLLGERGVGSLSLNISERLLGSKLGCDRLEEMLEPHAAYFPWLVLEVTETAAMENVEACVEMMQRLCDRGIRFSIDDFGTGFSSLLKLKQLPIYELKIDRSFVDELPDNKDDLAIVRTTVLMCRELGINVVAEGIETEAQEACLLASGCQLGQGYHFARPMTIEALIERLGAH
ncbi:putative bifunctional diguanylate cyclase/phosphodiesterase [Marinobacterium litorale]|uniref:putative bifunctional diguanylate cyclase/phosphodiesterase n=1 Tax=Marinobacterium litorale TaxID=404770 RepID=UPI0003FCAC71|nr:bifunctional diguanylate cyclase/phosphodiesterase [Marinobacterium litorale]